VKNCDITAVKDDKLIIIELKTKFSLSLLIQAVNRKEITDSVYVAVPVVHPKKIINNFKGIKKVLRHLEIGLIFVRFLKTKTRIETVLHPYPFRKRRMRKKRNRILQEIDGRYAEFNKGGSPSETERVSAYKQAAVKIAFLLDKLKKATPSQLKGFGTGPKTQGILSSNIYGWFDRIDRGVYSLNKAGRKSYKQYKELINILKNEDSI
jgi:hypothetical protein